MSNLNRLFLVAGAEGPAKEGVYGEDAEAGRVTAADLRGTGGEVLVGKLPARQDGRRVSAAIYRQPPPASPVEIH